MRKPASTMHCTERSHTPDSGARNVVRPRCGPARRVSQLGADYRAQHVGDQVLHVVGVAANAVVFDYQRTEVFDDFDESAGSIAITAAPKTRTSVGRRPQLARASRHHSCGNRMKDFVVSDRSEHSQFVQRGAVDQQDTTCDVADRNACEGPKDSRREINRPVDQSEDPDENDRNR